MFAFKEHNLICHHYELIWSLNFQVQELWIQGVRCETLPHNCNSELGDDQYWNVDALFLTSALESSGPCDSGTV